MNIAEKLQYEAMKYVKDADKYDYDIYLWKLWKKAVKTPHVISRMYLFSMPFGDAIGRPLPYANAVVKTYNVEFKDKSFIRIPAWFYDMEKEKCKQEEH